jgi:hypothetical protein
LNDVMDTHDGPFGTSPLWHPTAVQLEAFARGEDAADASGIDPHIAGCLICRIHVGRLEVEGREAADPAFISALSAGSPRIPSGVLDALRATESHADTGSVRAGQLWRARNRSDNARGAVAVLVWVRKVFETTAAILPVFLDTDLADSETLIIPSEGTPLQVELALFTNVDAEIQLSNLTTLIATLDIQDEVAALRFASRSGAQPPAHLMTGVPISRSDDQRLEFRHVVSELLASLYIDSYTETADDMDVHELLAQIHELSFFHLGLRVDPLRFDDMIYLDERHTLHPVAAVHHLATCVVVTAVSGPDSYAQLMNPRLPNACAAVQSRFPEGDSVAVCATGSDWPTVLLTSPHMDSAIEVPSGLVYDATFSGVPLDLNTLLLKHFEGLSDRWGDASTVRFDDVSGSLRNVEAMSASIVHDAIEATLATGNRASILAKKEGYSRLSATTADDISALIRGVLAGEDPAEAVNDLLGGRP